MGPFTNGPYIGGLIRLVSRFRVGAVREPPLHFVPIVSRETFFFQI
jgi:hypothetical protein